MKTNPKLSKEHRNFINDFMLHMGCDQSMLDRIDYKIVHIGSGVFEVLENKKKKKFKVVVEEIKD